MDKVISRTISEIDKVKNENLELNDKLNIARAENERLREENEKLKWLLETKCQSEWEKENAELKAENERLKEELKEAYEHYNFKRIHNEVINAENLKYSQALQEIREIAKEQLQDVSDRCINTTPMYIVHKHIIAKINEVIGAE